jgi:hypothetical protein
MRELTLELLSLLVDRVFAFFVGLWDPDRVERRERLDPVDVASIDSNSEVSVHVICGEEVDVSSGEADVTS